MKSGFVFVELLIVLAILVILASLAYPLYTSFVVASYTENTARDLGEALRRTQQKSMGSDADSKWGVHMTNNSFTLFRGLSWGSRVPGSEEEHSVPASVSISTTPQDIVFKKDGTADTPGTISVSGSDGRVITVSVNEAGRVSVQQ